MPEPDELPILRIEGDRGRELPAAEGIGSREQMLAGMLTPQNSVLYLAALLEAAGLETFEAVRVASKAHDHGEGRTSGQQRAILEAEMRSIRDTAATNIAAIAKVIDEHYYRYDSVDPEECFWKDFSGVEL